ncbi:MAG: hypothetical protein KJO36_05590 [Acidimicrobiia bacterium]|nr:hypothetical protein [Acidimicrobiia bacterium]
MPNVMIPGSTGDQAAAVICVGIAVMDHLFYMDSLPRGSGKFYASNHHEVGGGVAANAAVAVARLGGRASYIGCLGDDPAGRRIASDLRAAGVDVSSVAIIPGVSSPISAVLVDVAGERTIVNHTPAGLFEGGDVTAAGNVTDAQAVLVDPRWPAGAVAALTAARDTGIPGVFDFDREMDRTGEELATIASHVAFSREALAATTGSADPQEGLDRMSDVTDAWLAVTLGAEGVFWRVGGRTHHQPVFDIEVVDTVGAGDVFHGALALALGEGQPESEAVRFASAAAALKCSRPGGRAGTPDRTEVYDLMQAG